MKTAPLMSILAIAIAITLFFSCEKEENLTNDGTSSSFKSSLSEDFEEGTKSAYAAATVSLGSGTWYFDQALIGTLSNDHKNGSKSVRVRKTGSITMQFDHSSAGTVSVYHAKYGSDGTSTWALYMSSDDGSNWTQVGSTVTTSSTSLEEATFEVNQDCDVRFKIEKLTGGSNRINFDDFNITGYGSDNDDGNDDGDDGNGDDSDSTGSADDDDHLLLGNPSDAVASVVSANNYLMEKDYYSVGYSNEKLTPIWVSWHLEDDDFGDAERQDDFRADDDLPSSWYQVTASEFSGSGFDRGHLCPSADRKSTVDANSSTFLMTNMIPQSPNNNRVTWVALEKYARTLVNNGKELYIIGGPYGQGGTGSNGDATTVGNGVVVPSHTWKIIVVLDDGNNDLSRITTSTRVIAVYIPNDQDVNDYDWEDYRVSVDYIENKTGFDFLSNVNSSIETEIESEVDDETI